MNNKTVATLLCLMFPLYGLTGCGGPSAETQVKSQLAKVHPLSDKERALADAGAKKYFNHPWPTNDPAKKTVDGSFIACRPSDSNYNGFVSCTGYKPSVETGALSEITMYCGYREDLVGCSDQDTVK